MMEAKRRLSQQLNTTGGWIAGSVGVSLLGVYAFVKLKRYLETQQALTIDAAINAARNGRVKEVMKLIKRAGNPDVVDEDGRTCLMHAVDCHQDTVVHLLLDVCGADPNYRTDINGMTAMHIAAEKNSEGSMKLLLNAGATVDVTTDNGDTPLHYASMHGNYEIVQILLEANCSIDKRREGDGATALALAANGNHTQSLTLLLDSGADINSRLSGNEASPLLIAAKKDSTEAMEILLSYGSNIDETDAYGRTALMIAAKNNCVKSTEFLLAQGADPEIFSLDGKWTALHIACKHSHAKVVYKLLEFTENIDCKNSLGRTPLGIASAVGARSIVRELVLAGADVNDIQEQEGITSLACATMGGHMGVVKDLLIYGALPNGPLDYIEGDYEQTSSLFLPLHCAVSYKFPQIAKILKQHGALLQLRSSKFSCQTPLDILNQLKNDSSMNPTTIRELEESLSAATDQG